MPAARASKTVSLPLSALTMAICLWLPGDAASAPNVSWQEPAWGTALRKELMNAVRPIVERDLGAPVEFVVRELRVAKDRGFGWLEPQRPGGRPIEFESTPLAGANSSTNAVDGTTVHVFYRRQNSRWIAEEWSIGAKNVWWATTATCAEFRPVIPEYCS